MKKVLIVMGLFLGFLPLAHARNINTNQSPSQSNDGKPNHYGDWDVVYDKVLKTTTLIHQHRPYGEPVPGMGDSFTEGTFALQYSFQAVFSQVKGKPKVVMYWVFDNPLTGSDTSPGTEALKGLFKYSANTQFILQIDDQNSSFAVQNYHIGVFGDSLVGHHPYEEFRIPVTPDILDKLVAAKEVAGNLSSDDQNASKSFAFDQTFKDILKAFLFRVGEIEKSSSTK